MGVTELVIQVNSVVVLVVLVTYNLLPEHDRNRRFKPFSHS